MNALSINAFNLVKGCVLDVGMESEVVVLTNVRRDSDTEEVWCYGWTAEAVEPGGWTVGSIWASIFDYNEKVMVVGISINPDDKDTFDFGTN
jgi:hypothetical protein